MIAIDSNVIVYSFDKNGIYYQESVKFLNKLKSQNQRLAVTYFSLIEFFQIITDSNKMKNPLNKNVASNIVSSLFNNDDFEILEIDERIMKDAFLTVNEYKVVKYEIYDHLIAFTCKQNNISDFVTFNSKDFEKYSFLNVINPKEE